jgi:hypothetical protein
MFRIFLLLIAFLISCKATSPLTQKHILDFRSFTIETPVTWEKVKVQGIDSYVGKITINSKYSAEFDLGMYSNHLVDEDDPEAANRYTITWNTIDGRKAKIVSPRRVGNGITGIYIDSLWGEGLNRTRFNLYTHNLDKINEKLLLNAISTLKFFHPN